MIKRPLLFLFIILQFQCTNNKASHSTTKVATTAFKPHKEAVEVEKTILPIDIQLAADAQVSYPTTKTTIKKARSNFAKQQLTTDSLSTLFTNLLVNQIIPYWYQTPWSFEGHTAIPKEGHIACGYFVSTTLKDMGLHINRYKLAQQNPFNEARTLALDKPVIEIYNETIRANIKELQQRLKDGIYFIGFAQSHVGYLFKQKSQLFLIHSDYLSAEGVRIEAVEQSAVFGMFHQLYIAKISTNEQLLNKWLSQEKIDVQVE